MDINVIMFNTTNEYLIYYMNKPNEEEVINKYLNITLTNQNKKFPNHHSSPCPISLWSLFSPPRVGIGRSWTSVGFSAVACWHRFRLWTALNWCLQYPGPRVFQSLVAAITTYNKAYAEYLLTLDVNNFLPLLTLMSTKFIICWLQMSTVDVYCWHLDVNNRCKLLTSRCQQ